MIANRKKMMAIAARRQDGSATKNQGAVAARCRRYKSPGFRKASH
jgi:hypothetical protein